MNDARRIVFLSLSIALISGCSTASDKYSRAAATTDRSCYAILNRKDLDARLQAGQLYAIPIALDRVEKRDGVERRLYKALFDARQDRPVGNDATIYVRCESVGKNEKAYTFFSGYYSSAGAELLWDSAANEFWVRGWKCRFDSNGKSSGNDVRCDDLEPCKCRYEADEIHVLFCNW